VYEFGGKGRNKRRGGGTLSNLLKAMVFIMFVLVISGFLSYMVIVVGNDIYALVKSDELIDVNIPELATVDDIAKILSEKDVIRYPSVFKVYSVLKKDNGKFIPGDYTVSPSMNYDQLLGEFKAKKSERKTIKVTIPEGYTVDDIISLFVDGYGVGNRDKFVDVIQNGEFDYWFVNELTSLREGRKYRLEGYLYPDTYYFYTQYTRTTSEGVIVDVTEWNIINKILYNFSVKFDDRYVERAKELKMSFDDVIILASMIQMEAKYDTEYTMVSSVFHNRLNNPERTNGKLESDATIQYVLDERREELTVDDLNMDNPYNSYKYKGLPPGPITNPTTVAVNGALFPRKTSYFYFVAQKTGYSLFASTAAEHERNKVIARGQ